VKILVVEDDADLRYLYTMSLALTGYEAHSVEDGVDALRRIEQDPPDLLLLDLSLPRLGGESVATELAANARTRHIPIVIVTGQRLLAPPAYAVCVLAKPVDLDRLIAVVGQCLSTEGVRAHLPDTGRARRKPSEG
jgi:CheY-like chemotaxis protein